MEKILLPIIGSLVACLGLLALVVFKQSVLGWTFIGIGILFQIVNLIFIIKGRRNKSSLN